MIQKISDALALFFKKTALFSLIVLTVWLPGSILLVYLRLYVFPETTGGDELRMLAQEFRVSNAIETVFSPFYVGGILYAASQIKKGLQPTYIECMSHAVRRSFKLLTTRIGTGLIVLVGIIALIIPGVILLLRFAFIDPIVVLEGIGGSQARGLSSQLTQGKRWNILLTTITAFVGLAIIGSSVELALYALPGLTAQPNIFVVAVFCECIRSLLLSIINIILFLFYWDAKKELTST